ncbi:glycoside hydrolase family 12 protein [Schizopora paradoxa]|uniref:Glycoside hydrolase family 12 protein n=1 Tax=Schizopora paradoxa TaxID=27342 RepID=A0A0H2S0Q6_9AGAM|nr:glycoside hydrolase family 12 protein [Schizopora paradoxa]
MLSYLVGFVALASAVVASPTPLASVDTSVHCGQWDTVTAGNYEMLLDQWGISGASGSQCAHITSMSGSTIAWTTNWTWTGGSGVKTFTDMQLNAGIGKQLSAISSMPATWDWSYSLSSGAVADVAFDLFTASTPTGANVNEIMIWMANYNAGPISAEYGSNGQPTPKAANVNIAGHTWNMFFGSNGANNVYSFLPTSGTITSFSGDINAFFKYLTSNQGVSSSQYLKTAQAGTEPTSGTGTLTTSAFSLTIN